MRAYRMRNVVGVIVVYAVVFGLWVASPDPAVKEAHLMCEGSGSVAVFSDMNVCATDARYKAGKCACARPRSEWSRWYGLAVVPAIATVLGYLLLRGSLTTRLLLLNATVGVALVSEMVRALIIDPAAAMTILAYPVLLVAFCVGITAVFLLLHLLHRWLARGANASAT